MPDTLSFNRSIKTTILIRQNMTDYYMKKLFERPKRYDEFASSLNIVYIHNLESRLFVGDNLRISVLLVTSGLCMPPFIHLDGSPDVNSYINNSYAMFIYS